MRNSGARASARQAATVIGVAAALLVVTTVLLVPYLGASACFGSAADACRVNWTSPAGVPTSYPLWVGVQLGIIAAAVLLQLVFLRKVFLRKGGAVSRAG